MKITTQKTQKWVRISVLAIPLIVIFCILLIISPPGSIYEAILTTTSYIAAALLVFAANRYFTRKKTREKHIEIETQRYLNRRNGMRQFLYPFQHGNEKYANSKIRHEIWAIDEKTAFIIYKRKIRPLENPNKPKAFYYLNARTHNLR